MSLCRSGPWELDAAELWEGMDGDTDSSLLVRDREHSSLGAP